MARKPQLILVAALVLLLSACNISTQPPTDEPLNVPTINPGGKPVVIISSPPNNSEVVVGTQVLVSASATDAVGVTRVQLIANQQIVKTVSSEAPSGQTNFQAVLDYTPRQAGNVALQVVAYRGAVASDPAEVDIVVKATQAQVTATLNTGTGGNTGPVIDPNDPTCRALTNTGLNIRTGPSTIYDKITVLPAGIVVPIIGRMSDNTWWQVRYSFTVGWVSAAFTSVYGICTAVPVVAAPPTPTSNAPTPFPTPPPQPSFTPKPQPTATPGTPDLVISSIGGPTSVALPSSAVTYAVTITNTGSAPSGSFANQATLPDGSTADLGVVSNLNPGESISLSINYTFTSAGTYQIQAKADSNNQVTEQSEVNNTGSLTITVTGP